MAISVGIGLIPLVAPDFFKLFPSWSQTVLHSGITLGSITAIVLNAFFNGKGTGDIKKELAANTGIDVA